MRSPTLLQALLPLALALATLVSCMNPVHSDAVDVLGGEASGVRRGLGNRASPATAEKAPVSPISSSRAPCTR